MSFLSNNNSLCYSLLCVVFCISVWLSNKKVSLKSYVCVLVLIKKNDLKIKSNRHHTQKIFREGVLCSSQHGVFLSGMTGDGFWLPSLFFPEAQNFKNGLLHTKKHSHYFKFKKSTVGTYGLLFHICGCWNFLLLHSSLLYMIHIKPRYEG